MVVPVQAESRPPRLAGVAESPGARAARSPQAQQVVRREHQASRQQAMVQPQVA